MSFFHRRAAADAERHVTGEHALCAWQVSPSWYGLGLSAQTVHFGRRGQGPLSASRAEGKSAPNANAGYPKRLRFHPFGSCSIFAQDKGTVL